MHHLYKTSLGQQALHLRSPELNARQRRLLVLIGTEDFRQLSDTFRERIAAPELITQLMEMGLIASHTVTGPSFSAPMEHHAQTVESKECAEDRHTPSQVNLETEILRHSHKLEDATLNGDSAAQPDQQTILSFDEVKQLMQHSLRSHCGLMAKQLIAHIHNASDLRSLKLCQMQWITSLQESRISPLELNQILQQINISLQRQSRS